MSFLGIQGRTYLVTGVANRKSVAWHVARTLESEGAKVVYSVRNRARLDSLKGLLDGRSVHLCDLEHEEQTAALAEAVIGEHGPLDGLLHSVAFANYSKGLQPFHGTVRQDFLQATAVSCFSLVELARAFKAGLKPDASVVSVGISSQVTASSYGYMSPIKAALESAVRYMAYDLGPKGIRVFAVSPGPIMTRAASGIAYERFTPDGPFAVLPLHDGHYGVVWTLTPQAAEHVMALPDAEYLAALQRAFGWRIGRLERVGQRSAYPLKLTRASVVTGPRVALIGNAAQALHPVAGQGFNLGLRDAATLAEVLAERCRQDAAVDVGSDAVLAEFAARRSSDRDGVTRLTDGLVKLFGDTRPGVPLLRDLGLLLFDLSPSAKQAMSRLSWGFSGQIPRLARGLPLPGVKSA